MHRLLGIEIGVPDPSALDAFYQEIGFTGADRSWGPADQPGQIKIGEAAYRQLRQMRVACESEDDGFAFTAPLRFPDGIGIGTVIGKLFRYRERVRLDIEIAHNRVFARPDGGNSDRRCFMNDFVASTSFEKGTDTISNDFHRYVVSGVHAAREAVQRHNRHQTAPWSRVSVASR